jgi:hypothetical protein
MRVKPHDGPGVSSACTSDDLWESIQSESEKLSRVKPAQECVRGDKIQKRILSRPVRIGTSNVKVMISKANYNWVLWSGVNFGH